MYIPAQRLFITTASSAVNFDLKRNSQRVPEFLVAIEHGWVVVVVGHLNKIPILWTKVIRRVRKHITNLVHEHHHSDNSLTIGYTACVAVGIQSHRNVAATTKAQKPKKKKGVAGGKIKKKKKSMT